MVVRSFRLAGKAARDEIRKATATTANALSVAMLISMGLQPLLAGRSAVPVTFAALVVFVVLQGFVHNVLRRVED